MTKHPIPDDALDDRLFFGGTSGSGKTYNAGGRVERLLSKGNRVVVIDPLGVWWGLRLLADGKTESGYDVVIFGGPHGDLPLTENAGALLGETVASMKESCILDLSELGTKAAERRFMLDFLTVLYRKTGGEPVHVVFDEADIFAPQSLVGDKDGPAPRLLGMMETVVRRGRVKGFIPWLISQRPAVLNKNVLSQADGLVAFKLTSSQDRDAIGAWVEGQADKGVWKDMYGDLATLERGQGIVWMPSRKMLEIVKFPAKKTFDSSRTPKRGEKIATAELKPIDLGKLKERLGKVEADAKANDPKALKSEITRLKSELATKPTALVPTAPRREDAAALKSLRSALEATMKFIVQITAEGFIDGEGKGFDPGAIETALKGAVDQISKMVERKLEHRNIEFDKLRKEAARLIGKLKPLLAEDVSINLEVKHNAPFTMNERPQMTARPAPMPRRIANGTGESLPRGEKACLICAAQQDGGATREQLTVVTGYKRSSRDAYVQRLREKGYIQQDGDRVVATEEGIAALGSDYEPMPTGEALRAFHLQRLPEGERRVLELLISVYPDAKARDEIDEATGYKRSSRDAYLQRLTARQLVTGGRGEVRASDQLF